MYLKGAFKDSPFIIQLLMLITVVFFGMIAASFIGYFIAFAKCGFSIDAFNKIATNMADYPATLREIQFFSSLGTFVFPALFLAYLYSDDKKSYLQMETPISPSVAGWTLLSMIFALPVLNFTLYLNQQLVLPESMKVIENWMMSMEEEMAKFTEAMMHTKNLWDLIFNIVVIAILAGVGEEFMFRGVLQNVFRKLFKNEHVIIWIVAILFSAIHVQFYGFLPRMLMGAYFGYLLYYTKNIWIPVLAHFANNLFGVMTYYYFQDQPDQLKELDNLGTHSTWWLAIASLALWFWAFWEIRKKSVSQNLAS